MISFEEIIEKMIIEAINLKDENLLSFIEIPPNPELGDYAFPCFRLAKSLKKSPQVIAAELKEKINIDINIIEKIDVVGGYLNFYINKKTLIKTVLENIINKKEKFGSNNIGDGKTVVIEYSSPNIAKPFHIGHLRSTVIGGALYNIYKFLGYSTVGINFLGDWGLQFGKVMAGYSMWKDEYDFSDENAMTSILQIYVKFNKLEKEDESLTDSAREWFKKLENKDEEASRLWEYFRRISLENYKKTYETLNSNFDSFDGEAYYNDKMEPIINELNEKNLLIDSQGAKIVDLEKYDMPPCIIITSKGTTIYATRDITAFIDRVKKYNFEKMIYVVGAEQQLHFKQFLKVAELLGYEEYVNKTTHVPFGLIVDKDGEKIGSRKGNSVNLESILEESTNKVLEIINNKNSDIEDKENIAKKIGIGAVIFNDLSNSRIKDEIFDWDLLLNFNGETGPYLQYIYVRTKSILDKVNYVANNTNIEYDILVNKEVIKTAKLLYKFESVIIDAADKNEPSIIARYLIDLAQSFSNFYNEHKIIDENTEIQNARLSLTYSVGIVLKTGARLIGIEMPDRM